MAKAFDVKGYMRFDDGVVLPYLGEVNTISKEDWNRMCEAQAIKSFVADTGHAPESAAEAFAYFKQKYEKEDQTKNEQIPVRHGSVEIIPIEPRQNARRGAESPQTIS